MTTSAQIRQATAHTPATQLAHDARAHVDELFPNLEVLLGHAEPAVRPGKRRRTLQDEIAHFEREEAALSAQVEHTAGTLQALLDSAQDRLQRLLESAQTLSLERHTLSDRLAGLTGELEQEAEGGTLIHRMKALHEELSRLEAGLAWASVLHNVLLQSERALVPYTPALAAFPAYAALHALVAHYLDALPSGMALRGVLEQVRERTWAALRDALASALLVACEGIKWPSRIEYGAVPQTARRAFERAFQDLLVFQAESEALRDVHGGEWTDGSAILALQTMARPIALRFQYHFQGTKSTNRVDKPEWAFANVLDQIYEHTPFLAVLGRMTAGSGHDTDVRSEFTLALMPTVLGMLRARIPKLLDRPALLAHIVYQTVLFDDALREGGFALAHTTREGPWEGLTGVILREEGWYDRWLAGEKRFVDAQLHEIIASTDAWTITDEAIDEDDNSGYKPTVSARQVKALVEQITDRYAPLPQLRYRLPFLQSIQLPALDAYHARIVGSLDAFENLSSAFARAIPGALSGNTRGGVHFDEKRLTGGEAGMARLVKAHLSAGWMLEAVKDWREDLFFVELADEMQVDFFEAVVERFAELCARAEDMIVRLVTVEVEAHLKEHLKRRWDTQAGTTLDPTPHLIAAISTYTSLLRAMVDLPPVSVSRVYRRIAAHLVNHISQRAVYAGWSKFSAQGGRELGAEMADFTGASVEVLSVLPRPAGVGVEVPWRPLVDAARVLQLPEGEEEGDGGRVNFKHAMAAGWADGADSLKLFEERLGVKMDRATLQGILRRRVDCWR